MSTEVGTARWSAMSAGAGDPAGEPTLEALMAAYVDGDAAAFDALYAQVAPRLLSYLLRLTRNRARAEDLLQVTFIKVHRARSSYLRGAPLMPWLFAIARRSFLDERRAARVRKEDLSFDGALPEPVAAIGNDHNDVSEALERALEALPDAYREAIVLTKMSGLSVAQAAQVLGASVTAVKLRVHRGYKILRDQLDSYNRGTP